MAAVTGLILVKEFTYRGDNTEEWSNRYHFRDPPPGDDASWHVLAGDLIARETTIYSANHKVVAAYGYDSDDPKAHAVWSYDYALQGENHPGTYVTNPGEHETAGDQASMCWAQLNKKNTRGKWIYLRKYYHGAHTMTSNADQVGDAYATAVRDFWNGMCGGANVFWGGIRAQKYADQLVTNDLDKWITTRTLKRRGKRPLAPA